MTQTRASGHEALASLTLGGYRNLVGLTFLTLLLAPFLELYLLVRIGREIGALPVLALLLATAMLGSYIVRLKGQRVMAQAQAALAQGQVPEENIFGSALVLLGGILLIIPGVLSDALGILLLVPWTRAMFMRFLRGAVERRNTIGNVHVQSFNFGFPHSVGGASSDSQHTRPQREVRSQRPSAAPESRVSRAPTTVGHGPGRPTVVVETEGEEVCSRTQ